MKKRVLFAATTAKGHINVFHIPYIKMFKEHGWFVDVVTNGDERVPFADNEFSIPIERSPFKISNLKALYKIIGIMKNFKYDLVVCHTPMGGVLTRIAASITKTEPIIYMAHGFHFYDGAPAVNFFVYKNMEKLLAHWTDGLITINKEDFEAAKKFKLKKNGKAYLLPGIGVDIKRIKNTEVDIFKKRQELGIPREAFIVLNVGEMINRKNQVSAIKAVSECKDTNIFLAICGRGEKEKELKQLAINLGVDKRVVFCGFRKDIHEILKTADLFLFPSFQEGLPVAVMEAMASGLPIICSNVRGNRDLIDSGKGGYLHAPCDIKAISKSIIELKNDREKRNAFGSYNMIKSEQFDIKEVKEQMRAVYQEVIG